MDDLHRAFATAGESEVDALILVALYVLDFLCIHPFSDGNGRMVRLLTVLLLYREDYEVARYISLERLTEQTRETYYETLYRSSQGWHEEKHDPMPWVSYFLSVVRAAYDEFVRDVGELRDGRGMKTQLVFTGHYPSDRRFLCLRTSSTLSKRRLGNVATCLAC